MIIDARDPAAPRGVLVDDETGRRIAFARWANLQTGEYEAFAALPGGRVMEQPPRLIKGRSARLRWIPAARRYSPKAESAAEQRDRLAAERQIATRLVVVPGVLCEARGCGKLAEWRTADFQQVEPARGEDGRLYERAVMVAGHRYCSWHYRNPVEVSLRGVESELVVRARPQ